MLVSEKRSISRKAYVAAKQQREVVIEEEEAAETKLPVVEKLISISKDEPRVARIAWHPEETCALLDACNVFFKNPSYVKHGSNMQWDVIYPLIEWPNGACRSLTACKSRIFSLRKSFKKHIPHRNVAIQYRMEAIGPYLLRQVYESIEDDDSALRASAKSLPPVLPPPPSSNNTAHGSAVSTDPKPKKRRSRRSSRPTKPAVVVVLPSESTISGKQWRALTQSNNHQIVRENPININAVVVAEEEGSIVEESNIRTKVIKKSTLPRSAVVSHRRNAKTNRVQGMVWHGDYVIQLLFAWKWYEMNEQVRTGSSPDVSDITHWKIVAPSIDWKPPRSYFVSPKRCKEQHRRVRTSWKNSYGLSAAIRQAIIEFSLIDTSPFVVPDLDSSTSDADVVQQEEGGGEEMVEEATVSLQVEEEASSLKPQTSVMVRKGRDLDGRLTERFMTTMEESIHSPTAVMEAREIRRKRRQELAQRDMTHLGLMPVLKKIPPLPFLEGEQDASSDDTSNSSHILNFNLLRFHASSEEFARRTSLVEQLRMRVVDPTLCCKEI